MKMFAQNAERQLKWLYGLQSNGIKLGLNNVAYLLKRMGNPQNNFRTIHVAGSDGKGSTCAILASVLKAAGYRVGLFTSPHIIEFNERIQIDGEKINNDDLAYYASRVRHFVDDMRESDIYCTFFEVTTAMAFDYFSRKEVDIAVVEVGMGGRFDATNVINPDVTVINNISLEHMDYLGDTIEKIAFEKAGIIKEDVPTVTMNQGPALEVIRQVTAEKNSELTIVDPGVEVVSNGPKGPVFIRNGEQHLVSIPGRNSAKNACLALEALSKLKDYSEMIEPHVKEGLESVRWPCRMENLGNGYIIDVTHTNAGSVGLSKDNSEIYSKNEQMYGI
ncbi:MAG: bifunctional folylpolyglutamate synthase/dihydrofolate synthase, partial [archaeon]|nr:bifunctional folylpolyglutamate synthase/dihydrofolate synthase [archaeon]